MKQKKYFLHFRFYWVLIASLALTACGGGGGGDDDTIISSRSSSLSSTTSLSSQSSSSSLSSSVVSSSESSSTISSISSVVSSSSSNSSQSSVSSVSSSSSSSVIVVVDTVAPTISLSASNTNITTATNFMLTATANDNVGVSKVEFYDGTNLVSTALSAPYSHTINITASNNGTKTFKAIAYDAAGNSTPTAGLMVTIDIDTTPPSSVSLGSSSNSVTVAGNFTLTTTAIDNKAVTKVEFYDGTTLLGTDTVSPFNYNVSVTSANNGTKNYTSKAFDAAGNATVSNAVSVVINIDTSMPTISLSSSSLNVTSAGSITLAATATDNVGVSKVEFYDGTTLLGTDTVSPFDYNVSVTSANNGTKNYTSKAFDAAGNATVSNAVSVVINIDTSLPTVSLSSSSLNVTSAGSITLSATATDNVGVSKVEFYDGTTLLGTDTVSPFNYNVSVTSANNGTKNYTSKAFDAAGNATVSNAVSVVINIDTSLPTVSLSSSSLNVTSAGSITLSATATDNVGVSKVEFYDGTTLLNTDTGSPFSYVINFNTNFTGSKIYTAKAYDAAGNSATSTAVTVNISVNVDSIAPTVVSASPANNTTDVATTTPITITFSEAMKTDSVVGTLIVSDYPNGSNPVSQTFTATFSSDSKVATLSVAGGYQRGKVYQFDINAKDLAGNLMAATYPLTISMQQVFAGIYTAKNGTGTAVKVAVEYYPLTATGNPAPTRKLEGSDTTINDWKRLVIDSKANMYISTPTGIAVFRATDYGNVVPRQRMTGSNTGLTNPTALGLNSAETELFVLDQQNQSVSVFSATATGNVAPVRKISGVINNVKDMVLHGSEIFVLGGISTAPKIWVFNQSDRDNPAAKRVIDLPASHASINYLYAYGDKLLAPYGSASYQFVVISTLATSTNGSGSFVMERYHSDMGRTTPGTIAPAMLAVAGSQLWVNDYGLIYKLDADLSTVETGPATAQFSTTGNNTPFIFVVP